MFDEEVAREQSVRRLHRYLRAGIPFTWRIVVADNASRRSRPGPPHRKGPTMKPQILPKAAAGLCALLLAGGAGLAVSQARSDSALPSDGATQQGGPGAGLADALGVSESELQAAMDSLRSSMQPGQGGGPDDMAPALAKVLGLSETKVAAALEANRPDGSAAPDSSATPSPTDSSSAAVSS